MLYANAMAMATAVSAEHLLLAATTRFRCPYVLRSGSCTLQGHYSVVPDLCVIGKALGAGIPISALAGTKHVMGHLKPLGSAEMSGTFLAHLTGTAAALGALGEYSRTDFYPELLSRCQKFYDKLEEAFAGAPFPITVQHLGPRFGLYFGISGSVSNYSQVPPCYHACCIPLRAGPAPNRPSNCGLKRRTHLPAGRKEGHPGRIGIHSRMHRTVMPASHLVAYCWC